MQTLSFNAFLITSEIIQRVKYWGGLMGAECWQNSHSFSSTAKAEMFIEVWKVNCLI